MLDKNEQGVYLKFIMKQEIIASRTFNLLREAYVEDFILRDPVFE